MFEKNAENCRKVFSLVAEQKKLTNKANIY